ncbi:cupredoxin domain-containing protein [Fulvimarina sp. 2208YS6-2-32]|uniref:Cupredoxin domain-containing protein n=1 Tax=Fulvimarina uroteuthidis TaxID=3098149 RepID=A0ABU5I678_9HYPH|nr:plastocyanin/azurin family copper-binding protein [Fulvimarina sp. 2208YS6-2-32]MDY8110895.1 cupredoxin domain-containing protein [Fulvimarina sp. 2208YS6-2-32]
MRAYLTALSVGAFSLLALPAYAAGSHSGGHDDEMAIGKAGKVADVARTIEVVMSENDDGAMLFEPAAIKVRAGETVRFKIVNEGETDHEFVMDSEDEIQEHKALMEKFPEMEHADANAIRLEPANSGEIIWSFTKPGSFEFACLIPGHYESGMHGPLTVASK